MKTFKKYMNKARHFFSEISGLFAANTGSKASTEAEYETKRSFSKKAQQGTSENVNTNSKTDVEVDKQLQLALATEMYLWSLSYSDSSVLLYGGDTYSWMLGQTMLAMAYDNELQLN